MNEEMTDRSQGSKKVVVVLVAVAGVVVAVLALRSSPSDSSAVVLERVANAAPAPAPVQQPPAAPPEAPPTVDTPPEDAEAIQAALLGLDKQAPKGIAFMEQRARENANAQDPRPRPRPRRARVSDEPEYEETYAEPVKDGLSDDVFHSTIEKWRGVKSCVVNNKKSDRGALRVSFTIAGSGEVVSSRVFDESNSAARVIAPCVEKQVRSLKFPAFDGSTSVKEAKFVF